MESGERIEPGSADWNILEEMRLRRGAKAITDAIEILDEDADNINIPNEGMDTIEAEEAARQMRKFTPHGPEHR